MDVHEGRFVQIFPGVQLYTCHRRSYVVRRRRPFQTSECTNLAEAERYRHQVIRIISRKVSEIQNASLGEHVLRDLNDQINKRIGEKIRWEKRIIELGGATYSVGSGKDGYDAEGTSLKRGGYKYFGAAKNLPGVRELFEKQDAPKPKRSRYTFNSIFHRVVMEIYRKDIYQGIEPDYYGHLDEDDGELVREEAEVEAKRIQQAIDTWNQQQTNKEQAQV
ncbi:hypothetical protein DYB30_004587 [Aphanomyces astaci]|uniref:Pre-mRNA-splicing factor ISY1 n=1 Tax=Aphanomyces astaci TaxID=112090 RepID=A0A397DSW2_APHAT|nr:hypothetical protein DYB30_004587 [Aphanomyces astaci]